MSSAITRSSDVDRRRESPSDQITARLVRGQSGDNPGALCFLRSVFPEVSPDDFRSLAEDPTLRPADRVLAKDGSRTVGHVLMQSRTMLHGSNCLPVGVMQALAVAQRYRNQGLGWRLVRAAEALAMRDGAVVGLVRTTAPHFLRRRGWALCGRHSVSRADSRRVLGQLIESGLSRKNRRHTLHIRPWLRWELADLVNIYQQATQGMHGPLQRETEHWDWLTRREAYDEILVALEGPALADFEDQDTRVVGYAVIKEERVIELQALPGHRRAGAELLMRACSELIESGRHGVIYHAHPHDPLHEFFRNAGGHHVRHVADEGEVLMAKVLRPRRLIRSMAERLLARAKAAGVNEPWQLGILTEADAYLLHAEGGQLRVGRGLPENNVMEMNVADLTRTLLGQIDWDEAHEHGRLVVEHPDADYLARVLFPEFTLWRPLLDDFQRTSNLPRY